MSLVFSILLFAAPIFSWGDSLYLDSPRLGKVEYYASSGRTSQWVYSDVALLERNSASRWVMGLRPVPLSEKPAIKELVETAVIDSSESYELKTETKYWVGEGFYDYQYYDGPWNKIDGILAGLLPSYTVDVTDEPQGAGAQAVHGTLYCGQTQVFRSASGTYQLEAPQAASDVKSYLEGLAKRSFVKLDELAVDGILYMQGGFPLFFYVLETK